WNENEWKKFFDNLQQLQISEIIVQWSVFDGQSFYSSISSILGQADEHHLRVLVGLAADQDYWKQMNSAASAQEYFDSHFGQSVHAASARTTVAGKHPSFEG